MLERTADGRSRLNERYEWRSGVPVVHGGRFSGDVTGSVIPLDGFAPPRRYKRGRGRLWALDLDGRVVEGDLAEFCILTKPD